MTESRYIRQETLPQVGREGQALLAEARIAVVGLGALGSASSEVLARSGIGYLRLIDRDCVEFSNLQRCSLYTEEDALTSRPKTKAAAEHLRAINSTIEYEAHVCNVDSSNVVELLSGVDLVVDGADNFELRVLINEAANKLGIPWIYTGVLGTIGMLMPVLPEGPCFACLSPTPPAPGTYLTTTEAGILASTTRVAATLQAAMAMRLLLEGEKAKGAPPLSESGDALASTATLHQFDAWTTEFEEIVLEKNLDCPVCSHHRYDHLDARSTIQ